VTGQANLSRAMGRTWTAGVGYIRDVQFLAQLQEVMFSDGVNAFVGGLLNRRLSFWAGTGLSNGTVGFAVGDNHARAAYASVGVMSAVNRHVGIGTDYSYYYQFFGADVALPAGVRSDIGRHSIRAYVSLWAPVFIRGRSLDAAR
jgi:hypothetical protein